jgi:hypothetical protein
MKSNCCNFAYKEFLTWKRFLVSILPLQILRYVLSIQSHQHFKSSFSTIFFEPKKCKANLQVQKTMHITFVQKSTHKMLGKLVPYVKYVCKSCQHAMVAKFDDFLFLKNLYFLKFTLTMGTSFVLCTIF